MIPKYVKLALNFEFVDKFEFKKSMTSFIELLSLLHEEAKIKTRIPDLEAAIWNTANAYLEEIIAISMIDVDSFLKTVPDHITNLTKIVKVLESSSLRVKLCVFIQLLKLNQSVTTQEQLQVLRNSLNAIVTSL